MIVLENRPPNKVVIACESSILIQRYLPGASHPYHVLLLFLLLPRLLLLLRLLFFFLLFFFFCLLLVFLLLLFLLFFFFFASSYSSSSCYSYSCCSSSCSPSFPSSISSSSSSSHSPLSMQLAYHADRCMHSHTVLHILLIVSIPQTALVHVMPDVVHTPHICSPVNFSLLSSSSALPID